MGGGGVLGGVKGGERERKGGGGAGGFWGERAFSNMSRGVVCVSAGGGSGVGDVGLKMRAKEKKV